MNFGDALSVLRDGKEVRRRSWDPRLTIAKRGDNLAVLHRSFGSVHVSSWIPTSVSLLAVDWEPFTPPNRLRGHR